MINEVKKDLKQDGRTRLKNLQEQPGKEQHKVGSYWRSWERPSFSSGLTMADDDDEDSFAVEDTGDS